MRRAERNALQADASRPRPGSFTLLVHARRGELHAQPFMERLVEKLHESCSVSVLDGHDCVYVARVPAKRIMSINLVVGSRLPAHATSMGKVLLAALSPEALDRWLRHLHARQAPPSGRSATKRRCRKVLKDVRDRGWAFAEPRNRRTACERWRHRSWDRSRAVVAAINVLGTCGPRGSMNELRRHYLPLVIDASRQISRALGLTPGPA